MVVPEVVSVFKKMRGGYTTPFLVRCNDSSECYVLKAESNRTNGNDHIDPTDEIGSKALFNELVCGRLAKQLDIQIPDFKIVHLSKEIITANEEMLACGLKPGYCFASLYRKGRGISKSYVDISRNQKRLPEIILFDQIILNIDRYDRNDNILFDVKTKSFFVIDHTEAFDLGQIWTIHDLKARMSNNPPYVTECLNGVCYDIISTLVKGDNDFRRIKTACSEIDYKDLIKDIPDSWGISEDEKKAVIEFLKDRINNIDGIIKELRERLFHKWKGRS